MRIKFLLTVSLFIAFTASGASLWQSSEGASFYTEEKAHRIGDILTVMISERSSATQTATKDTNKAFSSSMNAGTGFLSKVKAGTAGSSNTFSGKGSTVASGNITATVSVKVVEVLPNGNLVVEGERMINVNNDIQEIKLRGEVRPRDIGSDNSLDSKLLADARIIYKGKGDVARSQRPNLFQRLLGMLF